MAILGGLISRAAGGLFRNLGKTNATPEQDWQGAVRTLGYEGAVARYPQQAALYGGARPGVGYDYVPDKYNPLPQQSYSPPAQRLALPAVYTPAMTLPGAALRALPTIPQLGTLAGRFTGQSLAAIRKTLPAMRRDLAIASGFSIVGGLVYDLAGNLVGKTRRRRRINPLNFRAAKRAASRLCQVQDLCSQILRALPSRGSSAPRVKRIGRRKRRARC